MSIDSLRSGAIEICFDPSLNVYPNKCRILIEGQMLDDGIAPEGQLIFMPSLRDVNEQFGEGSVIAEGLKTAFLCCGNNALDIYALPRKDASVGAVTKAQYTMTFTGDATTYGRVDMYMGDGRWRTSDWRGQPCCRATWPEGAWLTRRSSSFGRMRMLSCRFSSRRKESTGN